MSTFLMTLCLLEFIWLIAILTLGFFEVYLEYKKLKKHKFKLSYFISKIMLNVEFISVYLVGAVIIFCVAVPTTWFILIFNFIEELIKN